jgi:hypothetical protein
MEVAKTLVGLVDDAALVRGTATVAVQCQTRFDEAIFAPCTALVRTWVRNAGYTVYDTPPAGTAGAGASPPHLRILLYARHGGGPVDDPPSDAPYIVVNTEQADSPFFGEEGSVLRGLCARMYAGAKAVWCMDVPDAGFIASTFGVPKHKLAIVPMLMLGTLCPPSSR